MRNCTALKLTSFLLDQKVASSNFDETFSRQQRAAVVGACETRKRSNTVVFCYCCWLLFLSIFCFLLQFPFFVRFTLASCFFLLLANGQETIPMLLVIASLTRSPVLSATVRGLDFKKNWEKNIHCRYCAPFGSRMVPACALFACVCVCTGTFLCRFADFLFNLSHLDIQQAVIETTVVSA